MFSRADLHIHTTASDGAHTPLEIIKLAKENNIDTIAITDHNTVSGIARATEAGRQYGISVVPGVELSTRINGESIHLLGYFKDNRYMESTFQEILRLVKIHKADEARKLIGSFRSTKLQQNYLSVTEGINLLRLNGASVVLAHPVRVSTTNLPRLLDFPFDGIEAKYCYSSDYYTELFMKTALSKFAFYTGGSDFHTSKTNDRKHCSIGNPFLNSLEIQSFLENSGALILGTKVEEKVLNRYRSYFRS